MKLDQEELRDALKSIKAKAELALGNIDRKGTRALLGRMLREIGEIAGTFATLAISALLVWMFLEVTPPQFDAEHDWADAVAWEAGE